MARLMAVLVLAMMAVPAMSWGQAAQGDTVRVVRVVRVEHHSKAGEYAKAGFGLGAAGGALGWAVWATFQGHNRSPFGDTPYERRENMKQAAKWAAVSAAVGIVVGAIIGSGERWTEEQRVGLVPLDGGAMLALSLSWP